MKEKLTHTYEETYSEKIIPKEKIVQIVSRTMNETLIQKQSVIIGYSNLILKGRYCPDYVMAIFMAAFDTARQIRAIQKAIFLSEHNLPIPIIFYSNVEILDLEKISRESQE